MMSPAELLSNHFEREIFSFVFDFVLQAKVAEYL